MAVLGSKSFVLVTAVIAVLLLAAGGVYAVDRAQADRIAAGVTIGAVDVGGLSAAEAREKVAADLAAPLERDVVATYADVDLTLTRKTSRVAVDVDGSVRRALDASRQGNLLSRTARTLTGGEVDAALEPLVSYDEAGVDRLVERASERLDRAPRDATVEFADGALRIATSQDGRAVRRKALRSALTDALARPGTDSVAIELRRERAETSTKALAKRYPTVLSVDRQAFTLTIYKDLRASKTYDVAVGAIGLETPAGRYEIQNKAVDPTWNVPMSAWAGDLAGSVIPPGPSNPLKARWMGIFDGAGIHGTDQLASLGTAASKGCVRMAIPDVIELYDQVDVGTPIYIA